MRKRGIAILTFSIFVFGIFYLSSCDNNTTNLEDSLSIIENLEPVQGAQNATIKIEEGDANDSYFVINYDNLGRNNVLQNGKREAWCIEWNKSSTLNTEISGTKLYDTRGSEPFKALNYFLNIKNQLKENNPDITFREIQLVMWSLLGQQEQFPEFNLNNISIQDLPPRMRNDDQPLFDAALVEDMLNTVYSGLNSFEYETGQEFAVVTSTESDDQTTITLGDETMWAWGQYSFRGDVLLELCDGIGDDPNQWGWVYEFDPANGNTQTTALLAGAGQDDGDDTVAELISKGATKVGDLEIIYDPTAETLTITYSSIEPFEFNDLHLWVGCSLDEFCEVVNAGDNSPPGQFPYQHQVLENFTSYTFPPIDVSNCDGNFFISAHGGEAVGPVEAFN